MFHHVHNNNYYYNNCQLSLGESDAREKRDMAAKKKESESRIARLEAENAELRAMLNEKDLENKRLNEKAEQMKQNEQQLLKTIGVKEASFLDLQVSSNASIEALQSELRLIGEEYSRKEEEADALRDELVDANTRIEDLTTTRETERSEFAIKEKVGYYFFLISSNLQLYCTLLIIAFFVGIMRLFHLYIFIYIYIYIFIHLNFHIFINAYIHICMFIYVLHFIGGEKNFRLHTGQIGSTSQTFLVAGWSKGSIGCRWF